MPNIISISSAAECIRKADRVLVVGCSGAGKSTLSRKIAARFDLQYQSYDRDVRWMPGWQTRARSEQRDRVADLVSRARWAMDGNSPSTFDLRLPRADLMIWIRVPRRVAVMGVARRVAANYGKVRADMADGCPERVPDREFLSYIWTFERRVAPRIEAGLGKYAPDLPVAVLPTRKAGDALLAE